MAIQNRFADLIEELGLGRREDIRTVEVLTGGVASDIVRVDLRGRSLCLKCALERLKVQEEWHVPVHRNQAEYAWLTVAAEVNPESAVKLLGQSSREPCFAMEYIGGSDTYLWKTAILNGSIRQEEARNVGRAIGKVHAASVQTGFSTSSFKNRDDFSKLRLDPYLRFTANVHKEVARQLQNLVEQQYQADTVLVHGDISPKNILFRNGFPIILDAECATMGDASFDIAFCLNHLVLKAIHLPVIRSQLLNAVTSLWKTYVSYVHWEDHRKLEERVCTLLPALMLARIDGKSPVEYLDEKTRCWVREFSKLQLVNLSSTLEAFTDSLATQLQENYQ